MRDAIASEVAPTISPLPRSKRYESVLAGRVPIIGHHLKAATPMGGIAGVSNFEQTAVLWFLMSEFASSPQAAPAPPYNTDFLFDCENAQHCTPRFACHALLEPSFI
jgi:hypothetical protein